MAAVDPAKAAFDGLIEDLASLEEPAWLDIATLLLTFCHKFPPLPASWGPDNGAPWRKIAEIEMRVAGDLTKVGGADAHQPDEEDRDALESNAAPVLSSFATPDHIRALCDAAKRERDLAPFGETRMSLAVVARALAGAIDNLVGCTYLEWFRAKDKVKITEGEAYPVCSHDPRAWLNGHGANTDPETQPKRALDHTRRLRVATSPPGFDFVLDFTFWDRLSPLGSRNGLVMAAVQPNLDTSEFDMRNPTPSTYTNHGPKGNVPQVDRIQRLISQAAAEGAEVVLLPEYAVSEAVQTDLVKWFESSSTVPLLFCAGRARGPDTGGLMNNEAWLRVNTPGIEPGFSAHFHAKTFRATLALKDPKTGKKYFYNEHIRIASEVRVFVSQQWSLCVLICLEAMDGAIIGQLAQIGTNLLLVPSMSEKTATMVSAISRLCTESQAFVVMVNGPASYVGATAASRCEAFFGGPYADDPATWSAPLAHEKRQLDKEIVTWVFKAAQQSVASHPLPK